MSHHVRALANLEVATKLAHLILMFKKPTRCRRDQAAQTDINAIVEKYTRTGQLPPVRNAPQFGDATKFQGDLTQRLADANALQAQAQAELDDYIAKQKTKQKQNAESQAPQPSAQQPVTQTQQPSGAPEPQKT